MTHSVAASFQPMIQSWDMPQQLRAVFGSYPEVAWWVRPLMKHSGELEDPADAARLGNADCRLRSVDCWVEGDWALDTGTLAFGARIWQRPVSPKSWAEAMPSPQYRDLLARHGQSPDEADAADFARQLTRDHVRLPHFAQAMYVLGQLDPRKQPLPTAMVFRFLDEHGRHIREATMTVDHPGARGPGEPLDLWTNTLVHCCRSALESLALYPERARKIQGDGLPRA